MLKNPEKAKDIFKIVLAVLIFCTVAFIIIQSCLPPDVSSDESEAVSGFLSSILPEGTWIYSFVTENTRKLAHFFEYGALGFELSVYTIVYLRKKQLYFAILSVGSLLLGLLDETIQIFSNRGPAIIDVWIDTAGFNVFLYLTLGAYCLFAAVMRKFKYRSNLKKDNQNG